MPKGTLGPTLLSKLVLQENLKMACGRESSNLGNLNCIQAFYFTCLVFLFVLFFLLFVFSLLVCVCVQEEFNLLRPPLFSLYRLYILNPDGRPGWAMALRLSST